MQAQKTEILEKDGMTASLKTSLLSDALMRSIAPGATARISRHGVVIYTLPDGGKIYDTGRRISFSESARRAEIVDEGKRQFERPTVPRQRQREQGRER